MNRMYTIKHRCIYTICREGEDPKPDTFTKEQLEEQVALVKKEARAQQQKLLDELNVLKTKATMTSDERKELDKRIEDLQNQLMTKEEIAKREQDKLRKESEENIKKLTDEAGIWRNRYIDSTITRSIIDASVTNEAFNPEQLVALLRPSTSMREDKDEAGNVSYTPRVKFSDTDDKGKPITLDLSVEETVKRMKEITKYQNLFKGTGASGTGQTGNVDGSGIDLVKLAKTDPAAYRAARAKGVSL